MDIKEKFYKKMYLIRQFEETLNDFFKKGVLRGTTHGCIGQECVSVGIIESIDIKKDFVTSNHRGHGHYLALTDDVYGLACEIMGKKDGVIQGKGGSQHIHFQNFYTNGITGGMIPIAVGLALSIKIKKENSLVVAFLGDGAMNEGYVMEALNLAGVYQVPILFVLENNEYAMSTKTADFTSGKFENRIKGFDLKYKNMEAKNCLQIYDQSKSIIEEVKQNQYPYFLELQTYRFCGHSKSDHQEYKDLNRESYWKKNDPLLFLKKEIDNNNLLKIEKEVEHFVNEQFDRALKCEEPDPNLVLTHVPN